MLKPTPQEYTGNNVSITPTRAGAPNPVLGRIQDHKSATQRIELMQRELVVKHCTKDAISVHSHADEVQKFRLAASVAQIHILADVAQAWEDLADRARERSRHHASEMDQLNTRLRRVKLLADHCVAKQDFAPLYEFFTVSLLTLPEDASEEMVKAWGVSPDEL